MRKSIIAKVEQAVGSKTRAWLDIEALTRVELTSEDAACPFESAVNPGEGPGWRASGLGRQCIRLYFDEPRSIAFVHLEFEELEHARTQEFVLRWSTEGGEHPREAVRQQFNFAPPETTREIEEYSVALGGVSVLELEIVPDISGGAARAGLRALRLA
ncbi:MAG: hypothetical protein ACFCUJ_01140 [Thiotrichales bacterium]